MPERGEIWIISKVTLGQCKDDRPAVVIDVQTTEVGIVLLSSQMDLCRDGEDFRIDAAEPDFNKTGLRRTSHAILDSFIYVAPNRLLRRTGTLTGSLRKAFDAWATMQF